MPALLIEDLPKELYEKLEARAAANERSLSSEVIALLERALHERPAPLTLEEIDRLRVRPLKPLTQAILDEARKGRR